MAENPDYVHPEHPAAEAVLRSLQHLLESTGSPSAAFLQDHNISVVDESRDRAHARLDPRHASLSKHLPGYCLSPMAFGRGRDAGSWAFRFGHSAECHVHHFPINSTPHVLQIRRPCPEDTYQLSIDKACWDPLPKGRRWETPFIMVVGDSISDFRRHDIVGCILPIRLQTETAQNLELLHRGELFCVLALLHRQLRRNCRADPCSQVYRQFLALHVTIVAVTDDRVRVHEASFDDAPKYGVAGLVRITKRLDLNIHDVTGDANTMCDNGHTVGENWLDVMSYMGFADEDQVEPDPLARDAECDAAETVANPESKPELPVDAASHNIAATASNSIKPAQAVLQEAAVSEPVVEPPSNIFLTPSALKPRQPLAPISPNTTTPSEAGKTGSGKKNRSPAKHIRG